MGSTRQIVDSRGGTISRDFDGLDRLTKELTPNSPTGGISCTYDDAGNRKTMTVGGQPVVSYAYNDANQATGITQGTSSVGFAYDGLGRRVSKTVSKATTKYLYDGANVIQEQNASNVPTANLLTGLGIDQTFSRTDSGGQRSVLTDALGSTIALADTSGVIGTSYTYQPFGAATSTGTSSSNGFQFTGRENDGATGLDFNRARYYNPTFGRFISEDPLGFPGGPNPNLYAYVGNELTMLVDPFGLDPGNGCGYLGLSCVGRFFEQHWQTILIVGFDIAALGLSVYGFGLVVPVVSGLLVPGLEAAAPWLIAGAAASYGGFVTTYLTGGSTQDKIVTTSTNVAPALFPRSPGLSVFADAYQLFYDVSHGL